MRHTFATHLSKGGVPLRTAQSAMRHSESPKESRARQAAEDIDKTYNALVARCSEAAIRARIKRLGLSSLM